MCLYKVINFVHPPDPTERVGYKIFTQYPPVYPSRNCTPNLGFSYGPQVRGQFYGLTVVFDKWMACIQTLNFIPEYTVGFHVYVSREDAEWYKSCCSDARCKVYRVLYKDLRVEGVERYRDGRASYAHRECTVHVADKLYVPDQN